MKSRIPKKGEPGYSLYMRKLLERYHSRRNQFVDLLGGKCTCCGSTEQLEIDHIDSSQKELTVTTMCYSSMKRALAELAKCQLLCKSCHQKKTNNVDRGLDFFGKDGKVQFECAGCGIVKETNPQSYRKRLKNNKSGKVTCSRKCSAKVQFNLV